MYRFPLALLVLAAATFGTQAANDPPVTTDQMRLRLLDTCVGQQTALGGAGKASAVAKCQCYSGRVIKALTPAEGEALRARGDFSETGKAKAQAAFDSCKLGA